MEKNDYLEEIRSSEARTINGGGEAEMVGLGIAQAVAFGYAGLLGYVWVTYNFFKD
jgi:hypothetical protein